MKLLRRVGVIPVLNHYYEPWFNGYVDLESFHRVKPFVLEKQSYFIAHLGSLRIYKISQGETA
jgi:hypothetical protein